MAWYERLVALVPDWALARWPEFFATDRDRDLKAWIRNAAKSGTSVDYVEAHLREVGMTEKQASLFVRRHFKEATDSISALVDEIVAVRREHPRATDQALVAHVLNRAGWPGSQASIVQRALNALREREAKGKPWPGA